MENKKNIADRAGRGKGGRECRRCHTHRGVNRAYGLYICRRCLREVAPKMGFKKYA